MSHLECLLLFNVHACGGASRGTWRLFIVAPVLSVLPATMLGTPCRLTRAIQHSDPIYPASHSRISALLIICALNHVPTNRFSLHFPCNVLLFLAAPFRDRSILRDHARAVMTNMDFGLEYLMHNSVEDTLPWLSEHKTSNYQYIWHTFSPHEHSFTGCCMHYVSAS